MGSKISKAEEQAAKRENVCEKVVRDFRASFRKRRGQSVDRSAGGTLPRHLERGKNLSKRFRKSCRNWATSKGILNNNNKEEKTVKETNNNTETTLEDHDIVVIDLEEDPELRHRTSP